MQSIHPDLRMCAPPELAGRDVLIADILEGLDNAPGDPNRATIFVSA